MGGERAILIRAGPKGCPSHPHFWRCEMCRVIGCMGSLVLLLLTFTPPAHAVAKNWTFQGCWSPRTGSPCLDVYSDPLGDLWICKACGTTGNPGPGKCRRTTQAELDSGL